MLVEVLRDRIFLLKLMCFDDLGLVSMLLIIFIFAISP
ncbi:hypothetical protein Pse7367_2561 [Thalassoporum mexicanum PCC 7367]|nr:hypothetical protein Pse7367_2561 [Pseudanabaena sp. PCC 7367]